MNNLCTKVWVSLLIIFSLSVSLAFGEEPANVSSSQSEAVWMESESLGLLAAIGMVNPYDDGTYNLFGDMTRADAAVYIIRMLGENEAGLTTNTYFADVPNYHWAASSVEKLVNLGIISQDTAFRPDDAVTWMEMCKMMVSVAGYRSLAEAYGGYPNGYLKVAQEIGILKGVSNYLDAPCSRADAFQVIYNTMMTNMMDLSAINDTNAQYRESEHTILSYYHNICHTEGILDGVYGISLTGAVAPNKDQITIGGWLMDAGSVDDTDAFLGRTVTCYYRDDDSKREEAVYLYSDDDTITINADEIDSFEGYRLMYYTSQGRRTGVSVDPAAVVIKNGAPVTQNISDAFDLTYGTVTLAGTQPYPVAVIREVETLICGSVDTVNSLIYIDGLPSAPIDVSDNGKTVKLYQEGGMEVALADITRGSLLNVIRSENYTEICISSRTVDVEITSVDASQAYPVIEAGAETYRILPEIYQENQSILRPGMTVKLTFNMLGVVGNVQYKTAEMGAIQWAYLYMLNAQNGFQKNIITRMYTSAGDIRELCFADSIQVDGQRYRLDEKGDFDALVNQFTTPQLIVYRTNADGKISFIDSAQKGENEPESTLTRSLKWGSHTFIPWSMFQPLNFVEDTTLVVGVPPDDKIKDAKPSDFSVQDIRTGFDWQWVRDYNCETYRFNGESIVEDIVITRLDETENSIGSEWNYMIVVESVVSKLDADGNVVQAIRTIGRDGARVTYTMYEDMPLQDRREEVGHRKVEQGDCIVVDYWQDSQIGNIEIIYDASRNEWLGTLDDTADPRRGNMGDANRISMGYVSRFQDNYGLWSYAIGGDPKEGGKMEDVTIIVCEKGANGEIDVYEGTASGMRTYEDSGDNCSKIIAQARNGVPHTIVVYEDQ